MHITTTLQQFGFLASRRQLESVNIGRHRIDRAIADGDLLPVRRGWVATASASQASVIAVLRGARLTGATALGSYGIWCGDDHRIHLQVPEDSHRVTQAPLTPIARFTPPRFFVPKLVTHWAPFEIGEGPTPAWRVSISDAIGRFATTEPDDASECCAHHPAPPKTPASAVERPDIPCRIWPGNNLQNAI